MPGEGNEQAEETPEVVPPAAPLPTAEHSSVLAPGETCWKVARADRVSLIVDAQDYFRHAKAAMLEARHSIFLIGWDFDTRIKLEPGKKTLPGPNKLGRFLTWLAWKNKGLQIYLLKWDLGFLQNMPRGTTPLFILDWITSRRVHFRLDMNHPTGAAHHQKIAVVDDCVAFCGGIDMTGGRWDTRDHMEGDERRRAPSGEITKPWHDASLAVDGEAAKALGQITRLRWERATGNRIDEPNVRHSPWPPSLEPTLRDIDLGIARTWPGQEGETSIYEIEALTLSAIAAARDTLYIESQYLAARKIAEAIAARLQEPDGPEIVLVLPREADGWLEIKTMDSARTRLLRFLRANDPHKRFAMFYPVNAAGTAIYVHAKVLIMDDRLLRVGSSNLNNRSMGFDTECDIAIEALPGQAQEGEIRKTILAARYDLVAEHVGTSAEEVRSRHAELGSLAATIRELSVPDRNRLEEMPNGEEDLVDAALAEGELVDPERPGEVRKWKRRMFPFL